MLCWGPPPRLALSPPRLTLSLTCDNSGGDRTMIDRGEDDAAPKEADEDDDVLALVLLVRGDDVEAVRCEGDGGCVEEFSSSSS
jgi:hypothetical protein